jgi:L-iditol 2-dehydrogenase
MLLLLFTASNKLSSQCETLEFFATPPVHGSLANYVVHPADFCFALPDGMSLEEGAMCEPVSVGIHACRRGGVGPGSIVLILGAGPIGLVTLLVAKAFGATDIVVTDMSSERLAIAEQLGATATVNVTRHTTEQSAAAIAAALGNRKPTVTADCCGYESSMATALEATKSGGKVCLIGMGCQQMTLPLTTSASREIDILGVFRYRNTYPLAIQMISKGAIDVQPLITDRYDLQQDFSQSTVVKAFEQSAKGKHTIKVMFTLVDSAGAK